MLSAWHLLSINLSAFNPQIQHTDAQMAESLHMQIVMYENAGNQLHKQNINFFWLWINGPRTDTRKQISSLQ